MAGWTFFSRSIFGLFLFIPWSSFVWADTLTPIDITVRYDSAVYHFRYDGNQLSYVESSRRFTIADRPCDHAEIKRIAGTYNLLEQKYLKRANHSPTPYDVEIKTLNNEKLAISRGSQFGTWLRDLPKRIAYENLAAKVSCKR
jgi:hypothetical protein